MYSKMKQILTSLAAAFFCLFFLVSCGAKKSGADVTGKLEAPVTLTAAGKNKAYSFSALPLSKLKLISRKGLTSLYFDESSFCVCLYDGAANKLWRSLPEKETNENACLFSVNVLCGSKEYILDSQNDSAALKNAQYKTENGVLTLTYRFRKQLSKDAETDFTVPLRFELSDGLLKTTLDCKSITYGEKNGSIKIKSISLLSFFGADTDGAKGDFILLPDGCGAVLNTEKRAEKFSSISVPIYGADPAAKESSAFFACIPAFGKKSSNAAFVSLIESGEENAEIVAHKSLKKSGFNRVYAKFNLCKTFTDEKCGYVFQSGTDKTFSVSYRFLSGENTDYVSMASACRELLIRSGALKMEEREIAENEGLLFELSLIGSARLSKDGSSRVQQRTLTSLNEAEDIVSFLRSKGIKSINLRYRGLFEGGLVQNGYSSLRLFSPVGSKKELEEFSFLARSQNVSVFSDVSLFSAADEKSGALSIDGTKAEKTESFSGSLAEAKVTFSPGAKAEKNAEKMLSSLRSLPVEGVCVFDAGRVLFSDYSKGGTNERDSMKKLFSSYCGALSAGKKLMVNGANLYAVKYADFLTDVPSSAACAKGKLFTAVPFLQSVLHGCTDYSHTAFNKEKNSETAFLKAAEYGAVPSFEWHSADLGSDGEKDSFYYMNGANEAQQYYERLNAVFADLRGEKITAHKKVAGGVYLTAYGSSCSVYVNYNKKDVTVNGVTVEARSFQRVDF